MSSAAAIRAVAVIVIEARGCVVPSQLRELFHVDSRTVANALYDDSRLVRVYDYDKASGAKRFVFRLRKDVR